MELLFSALLIIIWVKNLAILSAIKWIAREGKNHVDYLDHTLPGKKVDKDTYYKSFEKHHGDFFPFGVKDFRLRKFIQTLKNADNILGRIGALLLTVFQKALFQYYVLANGVVLLIFALYVTDLAPPGMTGIEFLGTPLSTLLIALTLVSIIVMNILIEVEVCVGHIILDDYAKYFHMLCPTHTPFAASSSILLGTQVILAIGGTILFTNAGHVFFSYLAFDAFSGNLLPPYPLYDRLLIPIQCLYYTLTTLTTVGYGDIKPANIIGQLVSIGIQLQGLGLLTFILAIYWSTRKKL